MPFSELPQEIVDNIIDELHNDPVALAQCSLVNRSFFPCSRKHLFASIHIHPGRYVHRINIGNVYPLFLDLLEGSSSIAPLVISLRVSDLAGLVIGRRAAGETAPFGDIAARLPNVKHLTVDSKDDDGMPWHYIPIARILGLKTLIIGDKLRSLTLNKLGMDWSFVVVIAQSSALKELKMEDMTIDEGNYPSAALAALTVSKPQLEVLVLRMHALRYRHALLWDQSSFESFVEGLVGAPGFESYTWADVTHLQRLEFYEFASSEMHHDAMQKLLVHAKELKEFIWHKGDDAEPFIVAHIPTTTIVDITLG
ncbi:hypothetical protein BDZ89DRAFT_1112656 [Hymenopellis radicata]|nr:hypothetical protein BDZ89DRAFT_1112656 [Hymenopellis radicata]